MPAAFDSNVLLYFASGDANKAEIAEELLTRGGIISVQVLNEIASVTRRKMGFSWAETHEFLGVVNSLVRVTPLTTVVHQRGLAIAERYKLSIYDALIVAAALEADCDTLYSEDLHDGLVIDGLLRVANPFN